MKHFYLQFRKLLGIAGFGLGMIISSNSYAQAINPVADPIIGDSLEGFNTAAIMQLATTKGLDSAETQLFVARYQRRFINMRYNIPTAAANTDLSAFRVPAQVAMAPCTNMDFESGTFAGWSGFIGDNTLNSNGPLQNIQPGFFSNGVDALTTDMSARHTIMTTASGNDPCGGFPTVAPGGNYSVRLGNTYANYQGEAIEQTFTVGPGNTSFTYQYAVVLYDGGHSGGEQPYFRIEMFDQSGNLIPCAQYFVEASGSIPGFLPCGVGNVYKPWTTVNADLTAYIGNNVTIRFTAGGCIYSGHYAYAYVDASCLQYIISASDSLCAGSSIVLSAPVGAQDYLWSPGGQTTDSIVVSTPGTYTVTMTSVTGCQTQLQVTVSSYPDPVAQFNPTYPPCSTTYTFNNSSTIASGSITYQWDFGVPNTTTDTSTQASPTYTYTTPGSYTVTLIVTSQSGCDDTLTAIVNPGNAGFALYSNTTACFGAPTAFTDMSTSPPDWHWNFGDPASGMLDSSTVQNPTHIYTAPGTYTATLVVNTVPCPSVYQQTITVNPQPIPSISFVQACAAPLVNFSSTSTVTLPSTITSYGWNFGDAASGNNSSALQNPSHTFSGAGSYTVTLVVTTSNGCSQMTTQVISVGLPPSAAFTTNLVCTNSPMNFTNQSINSPVYHWDFGVPLTASDTSNLVNPVYTYTTPGTYTVTLIATPGPCADTATMVVTVAPGPAVQFAATQVCYGFPSVFTDQTVISSGNISNWSWNFGVSQITGDTSNVQNPGYVYPMPGTYNVILVTTSNNGCVGSDTMQVIVNEVPQANFTSDVVCEGSATTFTDLSVPVSGAITNWSWNFGDAGPGSSVQSPTHTYAVDSTYTVSLIVTNTAGCKDTITFQAINVALPVVQFVADTLAGCPMLCVDFSDSTTTATGSIVQWTWDFGDSTATSGQQNPSHCYSITGTYTITLTTMSSAGCVNTLVIPDMITVYPVPHASFTAIPMTTTVINPVVNFTDLSGGNPVAWSWNFGDPSTTIDTAITQNTTYTYSDEYGSLYPVYLSVTNQYGCVDDTTIEVIVEPEFTFFIPNAFTPNGDGKNEGFFGQGYGISKYEIWIFDRWGNLIFNTKDINQAWDGSVQGRGGDIAQEDVYVWKVALTDVFDKKHKFIGHVSLIR
ncbi:MAG: PKD domain-containing protein [Bacteroidia bacterium]